MSEALTIGELSETVDMTARNIRAYQSRGLLPSPEIRGRVAYYSGAHVARLQLIASLQREGFTLSAIQRLITGPDSYASIVADRRRRFQDGSSDIVTSVPLPHELVPDESHVEKMSAAGLAWRDEEGIVHTHTVLAGVGRTLEEHGLPVDLLARLQLEAAEAAGRLGDALRKHIDGVPELSEAQRRHLNDVAKIAVQLSAAAFEIAFLQRATGDGPSS
jgi:DNA-binding transcriptional MerR regulator